MPSGRFVFLNKVDESVGADNERWELGTNQYPGTIHPQGFQWIDEVEITHLVRIRFALPWGTLFKTIEVPAGRNAVHISYLLRAPATASKTVQLELRPLVSVRDYHSLTHENPSARWEPIVQRQGETMLAAGEDLGSRPPDRPAGGVTNLIRLHPYGSLPSLLFRARGRKEAGYGWYRRFNYVQEQMRGLDFEEDLWNPFALVFEIKSGEQIILTAEVEHQEPEVAGADKAAAGFPRTSTFSAQIADIPPPTSDPRYLSFALATLRHTAGTFFFRRPDRKVSVIAGFHWFTDWGRDSMISLPGLCAATGQWQFGRQILRSFAAFLKNGLVPNRFPDTGVEPEYNSVDTSLWFVHAVQEIDRHVPGSLNEFYPAIRDVLSSYRKGTSFGIQMAEDGLIYAGTRGVSLTWMDARIGEWPVTPRIGKPVEINALWFNALHVGRRAALARKDHELLDWIEPALQDFPDQFQRKFWNSETGYLNDAVLDPTPDTAMRPNQLFAVSLPEKLLGQDQARAALEKINAELLTPFGLRTLSPRHREYHGRYEGGPDSRNAAYHQGTVWPWLVGSYCDAVLYAEGETAEVARRLLEYFAPLQENLGYAGVNSIAEIFDGDPPHTPRGCISQAWSVAEGYRSFTRLKRISNGGTNL